MSVISPEMICGGCNSSYSACALSYPFLYYACGPVVLVNNLEDRQTKIALQGHKGQVNCVSVQNEYIITGGSDKKVIIWKDFAIYKQMLMSENVLYISTCVELIATICSDGILTMFSIPDFVPIQVLSFKKSLQETCAFGYWNDLFLATAGVDARIHIYIKKQAEFVYAGSLEGHIRNIRGLSFRSTSEALWLVSGGQDSLVRVWKISAEQEKDEISGKGAYTIGNYFCKLDAVLNGHSNLVCSVQWIDDTILTSSHDFSLILWHEDITTNTWSPKATFGQLGGNKNIFIGAVGDNKRIVAYSYSGGFYYWIDNNGKWVSGEAPTGHFNKVTDIWVNENFALTCSLDQTCRLWVRNGSYWQEASRPMVHGYDINGITVAGNQLISAADEKIVRMFDASASTAEILERFNIQINAVNRGSSQVLGLTTKTTTDAEINVRSLPLTEDLLNSFTLWPECHKLYGHGYEVCVVTASHSGTLLASACKSQTKEHARVFIWDIASKQKVQTLEFHTLGVTDMAFSPDDNFLLTVSRDRIWCLYAKINENYELKISKQVHSRVIYTCSWSPNSEIFATGSRDKKFKVWDLNGELIKNLSFSSPVTASCFLDKNIVAVGLEDGEIKLLNIENGLTIATMAHGDTVSKLKTHTGRLFSISSDNTFRIYLLR